MIIREEIFISLLILNLKVIYYFYLLIQIWGVLGVIVVYVFVEKC